MIVYGSPENQAEILKDQGNSYFKRDKLGAAIEAYTQVFLIATSLILATVCKIYFFLTGKKNSLDSFSRDFLS